MLKINYKIKKAIFFLALIFLSLTISGCIFSITNTPSSPQALALPLGIFRSDDASASWKTKSLLANVTGKLLAISDTSIYQLIFDPADHNTLYAATDKGLYYSLTGAESWQQAALFGTSPINSVAVDYFNKCNVFVAAGQSIYKSSDCLRTWQELYFDKSRPELQFSTVATEDYNKNIVYAANNFGEILKSMDFGKTWQTIKRINNPIKQILVDKDDTRIIYFATDSAGIFKTIDGGKTWSDEKPETDLNKGLDGFYDSKQFHNLVQDLTQKNTLVMASKYGLLKTTDGGLTWQNIELITPERGANIYGIAVDPKNDKLIYYGTDTTIYVSGDGGKNWATQKSPSSGLVNILLIDQQNPKIIYLGVKSK